MGTARTVGMKLEYFTIEELIGRINEPHRNICLKILEDHHPLFEKVQGSTHNHQAWEGGYIDHITDGMNLTLYMYGLLSAFQRPLPFSLSDALLIFFLHDLEKPWRIEIAKNGRVYNRPGLTTKEEFKQFREKKLAEYGLMLSPMQTNAFTYIEGEHKDYSSLHRVMNELAAFCHLVDTWCARGWYNYPKAEGDEWTGAGRFRKFSKEP